MSPVVSGRTMRGVQLRGRPFQTPIPWITLPGYPTGRFVVQYVTASVRLAPTTMLEFPDSMLAPGLFVTLVARLVLGKHQIATLSIVIMRSFLKRNAPTDLWRGAIVLYVLYNLELYTICHRSSAYLCRRLFRRESQQNHQIFFFSRHDRIFQERFFLQKASLLFLFLRVDKSDLP